MSEEKVETTYQDNSLNQVFRTLGKSRKMARNFGILPVPLVGFATTGFFIFEPDWYRDPFLVLILLVFTVGQLLALMQLRSLLSGIRNAHATTAILKEAGEEPELEELKKRLIKKAPLSHMRDLALHWIELGIRGETSGSEALLDNAWDRRSIQDDRMLSIHVLLNRTTLKLGFIGTLIGLLMTFPPMKNAILGLAGSDGEMKFIRDIAAAIDGDHYAILTTLVATALSMFIELLTIQFLGRTLGEFEMANSHLNDWNLSRLQPWIRRQYGPEARQKILMENHMRLEAKLLEAQAVMDKHINRMAEALSKTAKHLEELASTQGVVGHRISELGEFEKSYRSFLQIKQHAVSPPHLRPGDG